MIVDLIATLEALYPDKIDRENKSEFERGKDLGKIELIEEIKEMLEGKKDD